MRIGLLGGTFDPVHIGHLILASCAREQLKADRFIFIPNNKSPLKSDAPVAAFVDRLEMMRLAVRDTDGFDVNEEEGRRGGTSYTVDTLRGLSKQHPGAQFHLVLGQDALAEFALWKEHDTVLKLAQLAAVRRDTRAPWPTDIPVTPIAMPSVNISATMIRQRIHDGQSIDFYVPPAVVRHIRDHALYVKT